MYVNWGNVAAYGGIAFGLATAIGYAFAHDWRRALYFFFGVCITLCVIWK
jgi:type IV secretory pathway VirB2 component (pilin)